MSDVSGSGDAGSGSDQDGASPSTPPVPPESPPAPPPDAELQGARCARICKELCRVCMPHVGIRAEREVLAYYSTCVRQYGLGARDFTRVRRVLLYFPATTPATTLLTTLAWYTHLILTRFCATVSTCRDPGASDDTGLIVGAVAGGVVGLLLIVAALFCVRRKRQRGASDRSQRRRSKPQTTQNI